MKLVSLLSGNGFVLFNKELAHEVSVNGAIIFGQLCSSYESFGSKDMLTIREGKEYFFLTSEVIEEETALSYKQQLKAIKDLEEAGYIESVIMGTPAKKYFHITDKIIQQLLPKDDGSSDKKEELKEENEPEDTVKEQFIDLSSYDKKENQASNKGQGMPEQKGTTYKNKNEKKQSKIKNINFVNKESVYKDNNESINDAVKNKQDEIIHKLTNEYRNKGMSKDLCLKVVEEINNSKWRNKNSIENYGAYLRGCLERTLKHRQKSNGQEEPSLEFKKAIDYAEENGIPFFNWIEQ
jgi:DNA-binding PadR family transcriptional regulator